jgi:hypothetical protein
MSPTRLRYTELGLELVSLEENHSHQPKNPTKLENKRDDGAENPIKMFLVESLVQQTNEMLENFA